MPANKDNTKITLIDPAESFPQTSLLSEHEGFTYLVPPFKKMARQNEYDENCIKGVYLMERCFISWVEKRSNESVLKELGDYKSYPPYIRKFYNSWHTHDFTRLTIWKKVSSRENLKINEISWKMINAMDRSDRRRNNQNAEPNNPQNVSKNGVNRLQYMIGRWFSNRKQESYDDVDEDDSFNLRTVLEDIGCCFLEEQEKKKRVLNSLRKTIEQMN